MVLFLGEEEVKDLLTMKEALEVLENTFKEHGYGNVINEPRYRLRTGKSMLHYLAAAIPDLGVMGYKAYTSSREGLKFRVFLHDLNSGKLLSIMDANYMGMIRTGATTGVATKYLARGDSCVLGVFGTGYQAEGQIRAVCEVRDISKVKVYGRDKDRRVEFCKRISKLVDREVIPVDTPKEVVSGADIVVTATTSSLPVFDGRTLEEGTHLNAIGGNFLFKKEVDEITVKRSDVIVVESVEQCKMEAGELLPLVEKGVLRWENLIELGLIVAKRIEGRSSEDDITLFKSLGTAMEDIPIAYNIYKKAKEKSMGMMLDIPSI